MAFGVSQSFLHTYYFKSKLLNDPQFNVSILIKITALGSSFILVLLLSLIENTNRDIINPFALFVLVVTTISIVNKCLGVILPFKYHKH